MSQDEKDAREAFTKAIDEKLGEYVEGDFTVENDHMEEPLFEDDQDPDDLRNDNSETEENNNAITSSESGLFEGAEIYLPHGNRNEIAKALGRKRNSEGNLIGRAHKISALDSRIFTVRFPDGEEKDISYNILAEHLYSQMDSEGNQYRLFNALIGHRKRSSAVSKADGYRIVNGNKVKKRTTTRWDIEVEWRDGTASWLPLKEVKETNSVDLAQYAKDNSIIDEPAFAWWAPHT